MDVASSKQQTLESFRAVNILMLQPLAGMMEYDIPGENKNFFLSDDDLSLERLNTAIELILGDLSYLGENMVRETLLNYGPKAYRSLYGVEGQIALKDNLYDLLTLVGHRPDFKLDYSGKLIDMRRMFLCRTFEEFEI